MLFKTEVVNIISIATFLYHFKVFIIGLRYEDF
jgi:hypothetical protein